MGTREIWKHDAGGFVAATWRCARDTLAIETPARAASSWSVAPLGGLETREL